MSSIFFRINSDWLWANHPPDIRYSRMIFLSDNVLSPEVIQAMYRHKKSIDSIVTVYGDTWEKVCKKIPIVKAPDITKIIFGGLSRRKRDSNEAIDANSDDDYPFDDDDPFGAEENDKVSQDDKIATAEQYSTQYYPTPYCDIVEDMEMACIEFSILELWAKNGKYEDDLDKTINSLTTEDILYKINNVNTSGIFLVERNFTELLSGIRRNSTGQIVSAEATIIKWLAEMNTTEALLHPAKNRGEPISKYTMEFEGMMIEALLNQSQYPEGLKSYPNVHRSFGDIAGSTILGDLKGLVIGYMLLIAYVQIMLGRFNCVEQRALLTVAGILGVIMGVIMSYGLCSAIGLFYSTMHSVLPFLLLGIGIDDMFVIVQCWDVLDSKYKLRNKDGEGDEAISIPERLGRTMRSAGGAITVTSLTDIVGEYKN